MPQLYHYFLLFSITHMSSITESVLVYRRMFRGSHHKLEDSYFNKTINSSSILTETTNQVFQKEIDNYTRILEQDKRKFFRAQQNRNDLIKDYSTKQKELENLKSKQYKTQTMRKKGEAKILEGQLDQAINSYNEIIAYNKKLKAEIDELRKEKLNQKEGMRRLTSKIEEYSSAVGYRQLDIVKKQENIELSKQDILKIKQQNQHQAKCFREDVTIIQGSLNGGKSRSYLFKRRSQFDHKGDATDTQPLVKYRLKNLINSNKEKLRIVQNYKKGMHAIWQSFEDIKEESGGDLEQITNTLIKHEQQNHFIYEYIHNLNKEIEELNDHNTAMKQKIQEKKKENQQNLKMLKDTPEKTKAQLEENQLVTNYQSKIAHFYTFLTKSKPILQDFISSLTLDANIEVSQFSIQDHLAQIESLITSQYCQDESNPNIYKQEITKYAKLPPSLTDELREPKEQKLLDSDKFHEFACDYWQKKKPK